MGARSARARRGFTLIEIMAVVIIIGLTMAFVIPNFSATRYSQLRERARMIAGRLELARQRAIVTGAPHRMMIDLDEGTYALDWFVTEARAEQLSDEEQAELSAGQTELDESGNAPISLTPPTDKERNYHPIPNRFGELESLSENFLFAGISTPEGWIDQGSVQIVFERDGTSDYAVIVLKDAWDNEVRLEVQPLLDTVRIRQGDDD